MSIPCSVSLNLSQFLSLSFSLTLSLTWAQYNFPKIFNWNKVKQNNTNKNKSKLSISLDPNSSCSYQVVSFPFGNNFFFFKDFIYLFMRNIEGERERKAETQAEGEAGSIQGALRGIRSQVSRITPWAEGSAKPLSHPGCPGNIFLNYFSINASLLLFEITHWQSPVHSSEIVFVKITVILFPYFQQHLIMSFLGNSS